MPLTGTKIAGRVGAAVVLALTASLLTQLLLRGKGREKLAADANPSNGLSGRDSYHQWVQGRY